MDQKEPADRALSVRDMCNDAGISLATWPRQYRGKLPIVRLSPKRIGVRASDWRAELAQRTSGKGGADGSASQ